MSRLCVRWPSSAVGGLDGRSAARFASFFCNGGDCLDTAAPVCGVACADEKSDQDVDQEAEALWKEIAKLVRKPVVAKDADEHWMQMAIDGGRAFEKMCRNPGRRRKLEIFVSHFGRHGPETDMAWCLVQLSRGLIPEGGRRNLFERGPFREVQLEVAELKVRRFLEKPALLARYYDFLAWEPGRFTKGAFGNTLNDTIEGLGTPEDGYWWHALNAMILIHATGRNDLLKDAKPDEVADRFWEWRDWLELDWPNLRPAKDDWRWLLDEKAKREDEQIEDVPNWTVSPKFPFRDWKGVSPPDPKLLNKLR